MIFAISTAAFATEHLVAVKIGTTLCVPGHDGYTKVIGKADKDGAQKVTIYGSRMGEGMVPLGSLWMESQGNYNDNKFGGKFAKNEKGEDVSTDSDSKRHLMYVCKRQEK